MRRFRPIHGILIVAVTVAATLFAEYAFEGGFRRGDYERVAPGPDGMVRIDVGALKANDVRFFHFLNTSNQEVNFFVGRDGQGVVQVAFDANELCNKLKRGYRHEGEWVVCNKCDKAFRISEVNDGGGGCKPVPLAHRVESGQLLLAERDILTGWRLFH